MKKSAFFLFILALLMSGCVTLDNKKEEQLAAQSEQMASLQARIKEMEAENIALKDKIGAIEKELTAVPKIEKEVVIKMPTAAEIQQALKNANFYTGPIDGQIGTATKEAIKKFQEANGLNADGVMGSRTWDKLVKYLNLS
ncbi:MAG: peptidoglycan-binding protein [Candidatus Omnitrophica bacterium]|nr:peptidoglycan-binding protein [Candidatus Omnitrophota bacterium]